MGSPAIAKFGGISAQKQALAKTSMARLSVVESEVRTGERRQQQLLTILVSPFTRDYRRPHEAWRTGVRTTLTVRLAQACRPRCLQMMAFGPSGLDFVSGLRLRIIDANLQRRKTAFQLKGAAFGTFPRIELGLDSPIDFNSEPGRRKLAGTRVHIDIRKSCVATEYWLL
jgi:hypothetical protein